MFEVGKLYHRPGRNKTRDLFEVLFVGNNRTFIRFLDGVECCAWNKDFAEYIEYAEKFDV